MICAFDECGKEFDPHRHNQKYCSSECCKESTNKRIRKKYQDAKDRLGGKHRICSNSGCSTVLSRYTEGTICGKCLSEQSVAEREFLRRMFR